jgi:hypothetical protein
MKKAFILTPPDSTGGFHPLCVALMDERWEGARVDMGNRLIPNDPPELVVLSMRSDRQVDFGTRAFHALARTQVKNFGLFTTVDGMQKFIDAGLPTILGDRVKFVVIEKIDPTPVGWPQGIRVMRIFSPHTGTCLCLVRKEFLAHIGPERTPAPLVEHTADERIAAAS